MGGAVAGIRMGGLEILQALDLILHLKNWLVKERVGMCCVSGSRGQNHRSHRKR